MPCTRPARNSLTLWERHARPPGLRHHKTLIHPELGAIEVDCQVLFTEDQSQALLVLTAAPRTEAADKLHSWPSSARSASPGHAKCGTRHAGIIH